MDTPEGMVGYPHFEKEFVGAVGDFNSYAGVKCGTAKIVARWRTPRSYVSSHQHQVEVVVDGHTYTGRCAGSNMCFVGRLKRTK